MTDMTEKVFVQSSNNKESRNTVSDTLLNSFIINILFLNINMSSALNIRKKVSSERLQGTQERLRADHIQMMELLQKTVDSNSLLEEELERVKKQLNELGNSSSTASEGDMSEELTLAKERIKELEVQNECLKNLYEGKIEVIIYKHLYYIRYLSLIE